MINKILRKIINMTQEEYEVFKREECEKVYQKSIRNNRIGMHIMCSVKFFPEKVEAYEKRELERKLINELVLPPQPTYII